jgi:NitT/TauT family transport system permease protein
MGRSLTILDLRRPVEPRRYSTLALAAVLAGLVVWEMLALSRIIDPFFLPTPLTVGHTMWNLAREHNLLRDIAISFSRILGAFAVSAAVAIPLGILMSSVRWVEPIIEPFINFVRYLPVPALVPLCILWFGLGEWLKIVLLFIGTFFQLVLLVIDDADRVPQEYLELGLTLGAKSSETVTQILFPAMLPSLYRNLRVTLGWCWTYLLIGEMVAANSGLGHLVREGQRFARTDVVFCGVLIIGLIGLITDFFLKTAERKLFPYLVR